MQQPMTSTPIVPVVLCGGSGSRLWPLSRLDRPKQLLVLDGTRTLLEQTLMRCAPLGMPVLIGAEEHVYPMVEALRSLQLDVDVLTEPMGRNTAAAAAVVALELAERQGDPLLLLLPADHRVTNPTAFREAVARGVPAALEGRIVVFGVDPDGPSTAYGYIQPAGDALCGAPVTRFVEKPPLELARQFVEQGYLWNAGMFLVSAQGLLQAFEQHAPEILAAAQRARVDGVPRNGVRRLGATWLDVPAEALDRAVIEKADNVFVVPVSMGWTDLGTYESLHAGAEGEHGNAVVGDVVQEASTGNYLHADGVLLAVQDVHDLVIVATPDATLVAPRSSASDLKRLVSRLGSRKEVREHRSSERPWGQFRVLDVGEGFQVKRLTIAPGQGLSLQRHAQRDEHWIVAAGAGVVTIDEVTREVLANTPVLIPAGAAHRITNPHAEPLVLIEVQVGAYLGEDDIERLEDRYGRT